MQFFLRAALVAATLAAPAAAQAPVAGEGYYVANTDIRTDTCSDTVATASFLDGSYLAYDGWTLDHLSAGGLVLQRITSFPVFGFASFVTLSEDGATAYLGESSYGVIHEVDLATGATSVLATVPGNYALKLDRTPGFAYVVSNIFDADFGAGVLLSPNEVQRIDLATGVMELVASFSGYSGPLTVNEFGDLYVAQLTDALAFPLPPNTTRVLLFEDADLDSGTVLGALDGTVIIDQRDNLSSMAYDVGNDQLFIAETNTGPSAGDTVVWRLDPSGSIQEEVLRTASFAGELELLDTGAGTKLGPYQPPFTALRITGSDCFSAVPYRVRAEIRGLRPTNTFSGPSPGQSGTATFSLTGGVPNGFASLWLGRSSSFSSVDLITDLGGFFPIALRASAANYVRRFPITPLDPNGTTSFSYFQDVSIEGFAMGQWIVYDSNLEPVTSSNFRLNRTQF
ncbi:MAG: hypothetical protein VXZ39_05750 [Planctomycetota bacterium]|nr:hypothetical protein [Planctomycetota bacterium]MEC8494403.1 hypothetical protein [Planctomycetota bacterium]MEC8511124.1 hypothetical protein [Planctomycetota bacterium]